MRRAVFLDRDGVINFKPPPGDYVRRREDLRLIPQAADWIRLFNALDLLVIVVTNQRGVALGLIEPDELEAIHQAMRAQLAGAGALIDDVFCCPHEEGSCDCRKPKPGLVLEAARKWNIDLAASLLIGDTEIDRQLAENCGLRFLLCREGALV